MQKTIICIWLIFITTFLKSQEITPQPENTSDIIEQLATGSEDEIDLTDLQTEIAELLQNPVNLNEATEDDLRRIGFLSEFQIQSILEYRSLYGPILSIYELQYIYGFDAVSAKNLAPFFVVNQIQISGTNLPKHKFISHEIILRTQTLVETPAGYNKGSDSLQSNPAYSGNKARYFIKYKIEKSGYGAGFTAEKDPGESLTKDGFDYNSMYLQVDNKKFIKRAIVGDYGVCLGQGLILWTKYGSSKGSETVEIRKRNQGISKHSGTDENNFFRGAAIQLDFKPFQFTAFASSKPRDASTQTDSINGQKYIVSFLNSGIHATESQLKNRQNISENVLGSSFGYYNKSLKINLNSLYQKWNIPVSKSEKVYKKFDFYGSENLNLSADFLLLLKGLSIYAEGAASQNMQKAFVGGTSIFISDRITASFLIRFLDRGHQSFYGKPFSENGKASNESGWYTGIRWAATKRISISAFFDQYKFPWLKYSNSGPSAGYEAFLQADYNLNTITRVVFRYTYKQSQSDEKLTDSIPQNNVYNSQSHKYRCELKCTYGTNILLKTRLDYVFYKGNQTSEEGMYAFQDIQYSFEKIPFSFSSRFGIFNTKSYNTRIYAYEQDVLYAFSVPAVYQQGMRVYFLAQYALSRQIDLWFRIGQTYYSGNKTTGTGLDEVNGPSKTEIKFQLKWNF